MSTPITDLDALMPYSVPFGHGGDSADMQPITKEGAFGQKLYALPAGSYHVSLSYDGPEKCAFSYRDNRTTIWVVQAAMVEASASRQPRTSKVVPLTLPKGGIITVQCTPVMPTGSFGTASINIYPIAAKN